GLPGPHPPRCGVAGRPRRVQRLLRLDVHRPPGRTDRCGDPPPPPRHPGSPGMITTARITALLVAVPTFALLIAADRFTLDHLFFAPDLILCAALLFAAFTPRRRARRALILAFAFAAGVITTAVFSYVARG